MRIDPEFRRLIPPLHEDELRQLETNLVADGCRDPLVTWRDVLIDGHNRHEICERLRIKYRTVARDGFASRVEVMIWILDNQFGRRNLNDWQRAGLGVRKKQLLTREQLRERAKKGRARGGDATPEQIAARKERLSATVADKRSKKDSRKTVAKAAKVSERKIRTVEQIAKQRPEALEQIISGEKTLLDIKAEIRREEKAEVVERIRNEPQPLPEGPYRVIVADPPWPYGSRGEDPTHRARNPYPDMTLDEIHALPVAARATDDAVLWLWTTNAFMRDAFTVLDKWGFEQKTILTWVKDQMGTGDWLRGQTEHCLMAIKGRPVVTLTNQTTVLIANRGRHSEKPAEFYALVESLCPGARLEIFARTRRDGWEVWGGEVPDR